MDNTTQRIMQRNVEERPASGTSRTTLERQTMSWSAFKVIGFDPPIDMTYSTIRKAMKVFEKENEVNFQRLRYPGMLGWTLELEEKSHHMRTRSRDADRSDADVPPVIRKYTFVLSVFEKIFFTQKHLNKKMQGLMAKALKCTGFELLDMAFGDPNSLRLMYLQSESVNPMELEFQYRSRNFRMIDQIKSGYAVNDLVDVGPDKAKEARLSLGSDRNKIPCVSNVEISVKNAPIKTENPKLQGFRFSHVDMQISAPSVFHMYLDLVDEGIIKDIPPWIQKMRSRGKSHVQTIYQ